MNTDNFLIEETDLELAQEICKPLENSVKRNRALANAISANIAAKFFTEGNCTVDTESGLHNIAAILEKYDISDIYVDSAYIDVRTFFNEEELAVPKSHFDNNILPSAYMFIKLTSELSGATVMGFVLPENIDTSVSHNNYYTVDVNSLTSFYDVESHLIKTEDTYAVEDTEIYNYLDGSLKDNNEFINKLIVSKDGRERLAKAAKAQYIFNFVSVVPSASKEESLDANIEIDALIEEPSLDLETDTLDMLEEAPSLDLEESLEPNFDENDDSLLEESDEATFDLTESDIEDDVLPIEQDSTEIEAIGEIETSDDSIEIADELDITLEENTPEMVEEPEISLVEENVEESSTNATLSSVFPEISEEEDTSPALANFSDEIKMATQNKEDEELVALIDKTEDVEEDSSNIEEQNSSFDSFKTVIAPNIEIEEDNAEELTEEDLANIESAQPEEIVDANEQHEQIDTLFGSDSEEENITYSTPVKKQGGSLKFLLVVGLLVAIGAGGFYGYNQFMANQEEAAQMVDTEPVQENESLPEAKQEAMPVESVEAPTKNEKVTNEGNSIAIPAIEQNLDASIIVSNLKVDWEVPAGYATNTSAKRYLVKLGKIIQLNLKTELLLLNKPPITNKIGVEIKYNSSSRKFETVGVTTSSGEKSVDNIILQTVQKALAMNLSTNTDSFSNLQGNPTLIIRL